MSGVNLDLSLAYIGQTTLAVTLLVGLVLLVRRPFARHFGAKAAYTLWAIPAARLVLPPLPEGWSVFAPLGRAAPVEPAAQVFVPAPAPQPLPVSFAGDAAAPAVFEGLPPPPPVAPVTSSGLWPETLTAFGPATFVFVIWMLGAVAYLAWSWHRQAGFGRVVSREVQIAGPALQTEALSICQAIGLNHERVVIGTSLISDSPFVTGLLRPVIVLPAWFESDYTAEERRVALMHELMHVKRRDLWALQASTLFMALQWFNPAAHYALGAFRSDQEASCDADVLGLGASSPHAYGATLVKTVRKSRPVAEPMLAASLPLTHALTERLKQMRNPLPTFRQRLLGTALTVTLGSAALFASACTTASAHPQELEGGVEEEDKAVSRQVHRIIIDGDEDKRVVILDNPMDEVSFDFEALDNLSILIDEEAAHIEALVNDNVISITGDVVTALADATQNLVIEAENGQTVLSLNGDEIRFPQDVLAFTGDVLKLAAEGEAGEAELEALTEDFEARIEAWAEEFEARIEEMEPVWEARVEAYANRWSDAFEARIEAHAEEIERYSETMERHAERIEDAGELIEALADQCDREPGVHVVSETDAETDKTFKAVCVNDTELSKDEIVAELRATGELSEEQIERFERKFDKTNGFSFHWSFHQDD